MVGGLHEGQGDKGSAGGVGGEGELRAEVEGITANVLALGDLDRNALVHLREIVIAMKENAERRRKEARRAERRERKDAGPTGQADQEV